jgi:DNA-binding transcriptional ArsR family regulator
VASNFEVDVIRYLPNIQNMSDVFGALAHPIRRDVLHLLRRKPLAAGRIAEHFDIAKPTLSGHLAVLKAAKLVTAERKGTTIVYALNMPMLETAVAALNDIVNAKRAKMAWAFDRSL